MTDLTLPFSPASRSPSSPAEIWFAPLVGLRRGNRWVGLIGLELQPGTAPAQQHPVWRLLAWERAAADGTALPGIRAVFDDLFRPPGDPLPDRLRYPGRWIPTVGSNPATGLDYGALYHASQVDALGGFDQIVPMSWSFGQTAAVNALLSETSIILAQSGRAELARGDAGRVNLVGSVLTPVGLPEARPNGHGSTTADLSVTLTRPEPAGAAKPTRTGTPISPCPPDRRITPPTTGMDTPAPPPMAASRVWYSTVRSVRERGLPRAWTATGN